MPVVDFEVRTDKDGRQINEATVEIDGTTHTFRSTDVADADGPGGSWSYVGEGHAPTDAVRALEGALDHGTVDAETEPEEHEAAVAEVDTDG